MMILLTTLYFLSAALLAAYGLACVLYTLIYWRKVRPRVVDKQPLELPEQRPIVTIQLPVFNEQHVIGRLIDAAVAIEWPLDRLQIQLLDDSTDETSRIIAGLVGRYQSQGVWVEHIQRPNRQGYKAGALQHGLTTAAGEFVAIFDADFVPPADFLRKTIPCFAGQASDKPIGCVQTRWGHVNPETSPLTRAQALGIDGHFVIEQSARAATGAFMNFNGTAGVWRRECMVAAGGWQGDTLTEDLDLSYRAQLAGWRIAYQPDVVVPAELPVQIDGFKRQQFRWAKGSMQTAVKLFGRLWRSPEPRWRKLLGTLHLTNYAIHPLMVLNLLLTLPMALFESPLLRFVPLFMVSAIGPPLMYWVTMQSQELSLRAKLERLLVLVVLGTGLSLNNTKAVVEALTGVTSAFQRTPKFAVTGRDNRWQTSEYALPRDPIAWLELLFAIYAFGLVGWSIWQQNYYLIGWLLLYAAGYSFIAGLAFAQARQRRRRQHAYSLASSGLDD